MDADQLFYRANVMADPGLMAYYDKVKVPAGEGLVFEGEVSTDYYMVHSGTLRVVEGTGENAFTLATLEEGDVFGEISFFDGEARSATVRAEEDSVVLRMSRKKLVEILEKDPQLGINTLIALGIRTASRVRDTTDMLAGVLGKKDVKENRELSRLIKEVRTSAFGRPKWWQRS
ncbi:cyclic nucleotide-binding domain-containing protein [Candidatus Fermentibacterales bacterium]|nr:cyclic nucleotide-binding domain-containing protein [Candidatus Fermentibacterales bacterium]